MNKTVSKKFGLAMLAYVLTIFLMASLREEYAGTVWYWAFTILPMVPVAYAGTVLFKSVMEMDELIRRIHTEAIVFSAFVTGFVTFCWSLMSNAGMPEFPAIWVMPMLIAFWGLGLAWRKRKYE